MVADYLIERTKADRLAAIETAPEVEIVATALDQEPEVVDREITEPSPEPATEHERKMAEADADNEEVADSLGAGGPMAQVSGAARAAGTEPPPARRVTPPADAKTIAQELAADKKAAKAKKRLAQKGASLDRGREASLRRNHDGASRLTPYRDAGARIIAGNFPTFGFFIVFNDSSASALTMELRQSACGRVARVHSREINVAWREGELPFHRDSENFRVSTLGQLMEWMAHHGRKGGAK